MSKIRILIMLLFFPVFLNAQSFYEPVEEFPVFIGAEAGIISMGASLGDMDFIRASASSSNPYYYTEPHARVSSSNLIFGIRPEWYFKENRIGLSVGFRYTINENAVGKRNYKDFYYWKLNETGLNTEYLRVVKTVQYWQYLSVPLEAKFFLFEPTLIRAYIKAGAELGLLISSQTEIQFLKEEMGNYEGKLVSMLQKPGGVRAMLYSAVGLRMGRANTPSLNFEMVMPYFIANPEKGAMLDTFAGIGFQIGIQYPLKHSLNHE